MSALEHAPDFTTIDHLEHAHTLHSIMGARGLLLGFVGDIWLPSSVSLLRWLGAEAAPLHRMEVATAALVGNAPHMLRGFISASPVPPRFPLLADADRMIHAVYNMGQPGVMLIDAEGRIRGRWLPMKKGLPRPKRLLRLVEALGMTMG
jgi:peroxiredoxin